MSTETQQSRGDYVATREYHRDLEDPTRLERWARTSRLTDAMYAHEREDRENLAHKTLDLHPLN